MSDITDAKIDALKIIINNIQFHSEKIKEILLSVHWNDTEREIQLDRYVNSVGLVELNKQRYEIIDSITKM